MESGQPSAIGVMQEISSNHSESACLQQINVMRKAPGYFDVVLLRVVLL